MDPFHVLDRIHERTRIESAATEPEHAQFLWSPPWLELSSDTGGMTLGDGKALLTAPARLYTGEPVRTQLAARRILELETARLLLRTHTTDRSLLAWIRQTHESALRQCYAASGCVVGECSLVAIAFMRYAAASPWDRSGQLLARQIQNLRHLRSTRNRWLRVPFYYTLLTLLESAPICAAARDELQFARPSCHQASRRIRVPQPYRHRREEILEAVAAATGSTP